MELWGQRGGGRVQVQTLQGEKKPNSHQDARHIGDVCSVQIIVPQEFSQHFLI